MNDNELLTTFFFQACWEHLVNDDERAAQNILMTTLTFFFTGYPCAVASRTC